jgi:hypothetical protein
MRLKTMMLRVYWNRSEGTKEENNIKPGNKRLSPMRIGVLEEERKNISTI